MRKQTMMTLAAALLLMAGCSTAQKPVEKSLVETGILTLSVNPEIEIEYDKRGLVTEVSGMNEDAKRIVTDASAYTGQQCSSVVNDLVGKIYEAGYFVDEMDGSVRNIVIQIEPGSVLPEEHFLENVSASLQDTVKTLNAKNDVVSIGHDDYDDKYDRGTEPSRYITLEKAQEIALAHLDIASKDARFTEKEYDLDDGRAVYELELKANGVEYDVEVDAESGRVIEVDMDRDDRDERPVSAPEITPEPTKEPAGITLEQAKQIALDHFSLNASDVRFEEKETDRDDGRQVYELEMKSGNREYEIEIDAETGRVLESDSDWDD